MSGFHTLIAEGGRFHYVLGTLAAICASPAMSQYRIGITATPIVRRRQYRDAIKIQYPHFVLLATELRLEDALNIEGELQSACCEQPTSFLYGKYDPTVRGRKHQRSAGGSAKYLGKDYSVYITWR